MSRKGYAFTLIEMLLVVSLIAMLIALLLPALGAARDEARAQACAAQHRAWGVAFIQYRADSSQLLPLFADKYDVTGANSLDSATLWYNTTAPYVGLEKVTPDMPAATKSAINGRNYSAQVRRCPSDPAVYLGVHYGGFNSTRPARAPINYGRNVSSEASVRYSINRDRNPSRWMMLCDTNAHFIYTPASWTRTVDFDGDGRPDSHPGVLGIEGVIHYYNRGRPTVHRGSGVYAFVDGHVERVSFADWLDIGHTMWVGR
ncbi:MAG: hypothetical protein WD768_14245 [Phycisphaeraceae bacterium]